MLRHDWMIDGSLPLTSCISRTYLMLNALTAANLKQVVLMRAKSGELKMREKHVVLRVAIVGCDDCIYLIYTRIMDLLIVLKMLKVFKTGL